MRARRGATAPRERDHNAAAAPHHPPSGSRPTCSATVRLTAAPSSQHARTIASRSRTFARVVVDVTATLLFFVVEATRS